MAALVPAGLALSALCGAAEPGGRGPFRPATAPAKPSAARVAEARQRLLRLAQPPAVTAAQRQQIRKLLAELGHDDYRVREQATRRLREMGPPVLPFVNEALRSADAEVATRAELIISALERRTATAGAEVSAAVDTLAAAEDRSLVPTLFRLLIHANVSVRSAAGAGLRRVTGKSFGYCGYGKPADRDRAAAAWRRWWGKHGAAFRFDRGRLSRSVAGLLIADDRVNTLTLVTLTGEVVWNRKFARRIHCAAALPNGHYLVGFSNSSGQETNLAEFGLDDKLVRTERAFNLGRGMIYDIRALPGGNLLIAYVGDHHVSEVTPDGKCVWQHKGGMQSPGAAERLPNGNTLICVNHGSKAIEVNPRGEVVWQKTGLSNPCDVARLPNGNTLISVWGDRRVIEVDRAGSTVWERKCSGSPSAVCRLADGTTVINDKSEGTILVDRTGKKVRMLFRHTSGGKVRPAPAGFVRLRRKPS